MPSRLNPVVVVTGTGTGVGKTHVAAALLSAWGAHRAVVGYKPVETGVEDAARGGDDARRLARASTFHVKQPAFFQTFKAPISPHLAARSAGVPLRLHRMAQQAELLARQAEGVVVELAGGLFTPLSRHRVNADFALRLDTRRVVLVAPDRLGVLHDVGAALRAAAQMGLPLRGIVLCAPRVPDASTGTNAEEIAWALRGRVLARFPRAPSGARASCHAAFELLQALDLPHET